MKEKPKYTKLTNELKLEIYALCREGWSPEQTAAFLKVKGIANIHHETIYKHVIIDRMAGATLYQHLRHPN